MNLKHLTNPKNRTYPRYETVEIQSDGRKIQKEHLSPVHARLYFPDWNGQLRLILINDGDSHEYCVLSEAILEREFGVSYQALKIKANGYINVYNLDHRNYHPAALYPAEPPLANSTQAVVQPPELPPIASDDAWI